MLRGNPTPGRHDAVLEDGLEAQGEGVALTQSGLGRTSCDAWWARGHAEAAYTLPETQADLVVSGWLRAWIDPEGAVLRLSGVVVVNDAEGLRTTRIVEDRIFAGFGCF